MQVSSHAGRLFRELCVRNFEPNLFATGELEQKLQAVGSSFHAYYLRMLVTHHTNDFSFKRINRENGDRISDSVRKNSFVVRDEPLKDTAVEDIRNSSSSVA